MVLIFIVLLMISIVTLFTLLVIKQFRSKSKLNWRDTAIGGGIGFITDFLDTLGIGSFVTTTTIFQYLHYIKDERKLPGTLNVAQAIPVSVEALFFITAINVEPLTLFSMVIASIIGAYLGSWIIVKLNQNLIQRIMAIALIITSLLMLANKMGWLKILATDNNAMGLHGVALVIGILGNFIFGMLMSAGVGLYAPCMVLVYLLGLNPLAAFPIMMLSCALLMPISSINFIRKDRFSMKGIFGIIIGGALGVIVAATFVKNLPLEIVSWLVVVISFITAYQLWRSSRT